MTAPLPGLLASLAPMLDHYGYLAIGGLLLVEDFGVPVPGETVLIAGAVYAGAGRLNIVAIGVIAVVAAISGDNIGYVIGRWGGRALLARYGRDVLLTGPRLDRAERFFTRHGGKVVVIARFLDFLRQANGIIAGMTGMPWRRFLACNALGAALWAGLWTSLGRPGRPAHRHHLSRDRPLFAVPAGRLVRRDPDGDGASPGRPPRQPPAGCRR
jgi:membrane protein DedA with SNARE-associated domain